MRHSYPLSIPRLVLAIALTAPLSAHGATLRSFTTLTASTVRLSDLFDNAGPNATLVLGPGPAPGARIVVNAPQLAAIARQFGVDWHPTSAADRATLDRPGRPLARDDVLNALRVALNSAGAPPDFDIQLPGFSSPLVAPEAHPQAVIEQLDYDAGTGRFTGLLEVFGDGMSATTMRLAGSVTAMIEIPVLLHSLPIGSVISTDDLQMMRIRLDLAKGPVARSASQMVGLAVKREVSAGQPVPLATLGRPLAIRSGAPVTMELQQPGIDLVAEGQALASAGIGDRVRVLNPISRAVVAGEVIGIGRVRIAPGSLPLVQSEGRALRFSSVGGGTIVR